MKKVRNYMKKSLETLDWSFLEEKKETSFFASILTLKQKMLLLGLFSLSLPILIFAVGHRSLASVSLCDESAVQFSSMPVASTTVKKGVISIPSGMVKANPFLPYRDLDSVGSISEVSNFEVVEPPEVLNENSDAARVMDTIVSGILFDKYSPSAILNIEGNDYLVKKGDTVNNYKVLSILEDSVTVKLGANVYKAGIGEILTEGTLNHNDVSNLNNKFGGVQ